MKKWKLKRSWKYDKSIWRVQSNEGQCKWSKEVLATTKRKYRTHVGVKVAMDSHSGRHFVSSEEINSVTDEWPEMVPRQHEWHIWEENLIIRLELEFLIAVEAIAQQGKRTTLSWIGWVENGSGRRPRGLRGFVLLLQLHVGAERIGFGSRSVDHVKPGRPT